MTHELNHRQEPGRSMPGFPSKAIIATAVALIAVLCHLSLAGHGLGGVWAAQPVPGSVNTLALEGCPIESPDGYLFMAPEREGDLSIDIGPRTARGKTIAGASLAGCRSR